MNRFGRFCTSKTVSMNYFANIRFMYQSKNLLVRFFIFFLKKVQNIRIWGTVDCKAVVCFHYEKCLIKRKKRKCWLKGARRIRRNTRKGERWGVLLKEIARNYQEFISQMIFLSRI